MGSGELILKTYVKVGLRRLHLSITPPMSPLPVNPPFSFSLLAATRSQPLCRNSATASKWRASNPRAVSAGVLSLTLPGLIADVSPGMLFLSAVIPASCSTRSTFDPVIVQDVIVRAAGHEDVSAPRAPPRRRRRRLRR